MRFDVYGSTSRMYVLIDEVPYACVDLPPGGLAAGPATVEYSDILFVSSQDFSVPWYAFDEAHRQDVTSRHFSNLGFSSLVLAPPWDETRLPCVPAGLLH